MNLEIEAYEGELRELRKAAEMALDVLSHSLGHSNEAQEQIDKTKQALRQALENPEQKSKLEWFPAPIKTEWGENMVCAAVNIDDNHYFDVYCEEWQKENVELMLGVKNGA